MLDSSTEPLLDAAYAFLASGGHPTLREWLDLTPLERAALERAKTLLDVKRAQTLARAQQGPLAVAELMAEVDDGDAVATLLCQAWAERAAQSLEGTKVG